MRVIGALLTLFAWGGIPATTYSAYTGEFKGESNVGRQGRLRLVLPHQGCPARRNAKALL